MRLLIDGTETPLDFSRLPTLKAVLGEATRRAASVGRIVHGVQVDGREISPRAEQEMADLPVSEIGELRVRTTTSGQLLAEAIDGAIQLTGTLRRDIRGALGLLRSDDVSGAESLYVACVESLGTFFQLAGAVFNGVREGAFLLPGSDGASGAELPEPPEATTDILQRLLAAHEAKDWRRMADLLEGEIVPNLGKWSDFFSAMKGTEPR